MPGRKHLVFALLLLCLLPATSQTSVARPGTSLTIRPTNRVLQTIDEAKHFKLAGQRHPLARPEYSIGPAASEARMERMVLVLRGDPAQDSALEELIRAQQDPASPNYHHWLTPRQFGQQFGVSAHDLKEVTDWLASNGMLVDEIPASRRSVIFTGTVAQVEQALSTSIHLYSVLGETHYANATDPQIPLALAPVVSGVLALHDFRSVALHSTGPAYTASNGAHLLMPQDWSTIYNVLPLYSRGIDGAGVSIAVLGRVDIALSDIRSFRGNAGLSPNDPKVIITGPDPGFPCCGDELESTMDVEWAGAIAKSATVKFVTAQSGTSDGIALAAQYAVNHKIAPIVSLSYGICEAALGSSGNAFWNAIWMQAAAQGMSVFVAAGDSGAAGCDSGAEAKVLHGLAVNGLCSSPYSTCIGGTQFDDGSNPGQYWSSTNGFGHSSALGYIPESTWNESSSSSGLWAGGGGASLLYKKPVWQAAPGVPNDSKRDVPDLSLHASGRDAYVVQFQGATILAAGTSMAAPVMASVLAMAVEADGPQGNANPVLYRLANQQFNAQGPIAFHDITGGNNNVPGLKGFNAGVGYDQATGLGSIDASVLLSNWNNSTGTNFSLNPSVSTVFLRRGSSDTITVGISFQGGFNSPVTVSARGMPSDLTVKLSSTSLAQSSPITITVSATASAVVGTSTITLSASGGGLTRTVSLSVTVVRPSFSLTEKVSGLVVSTGSFTTLTLKTSTTNGFDSVISLAVSGLPKGVTAGFSPPKIASPGDGTSTLTLKASPTAAVGNSTFAVVAFGGGNTVRETLSLTVHRRRYRRTL